MYSWRSSPGELAERVRRDSGHGRPRGARDRDRGPALGAKLLVRADGSTEGGLGDAALDQVSRGGRGHLWAERSETREAGDTKLFVDVVAPAPRLVVFGAVDYAAALCRLARAAGWRPFVRPALAVRHAGALSGRRGGDRQWPDQGVRAARRHRPRHLHRDPDPRPSWTTPRSRRAGLRRGLRGRHGQPPRQAHRRERLLAAGVEEGLLDRIAAPIGLDLGAVSPEETALSIMVEVVAVRNGRGGRSRRPAGASTRWALDRRPRAGGGRRHALQRRSSSPTSTACRCSSTRFAR